MYMNGPMVPNSPKAPKAPKDPVIKKQGFYIMLDKVIESSKRQTGKPSQEIYLNDGRLVNCAKIVGNIVDEDMLALLKDCVGFKKLVHSIGVSILSTDKDQVVDFVFQMYGKKDLYGGGTVIGIPIIANGVENIIPLEEVQWSTDDHIPGKLSFEFQQPEAIASVSVKLYLHDGYKVPEVDVEVPIDFESKLYEEMIAKSLIQTGNNERLKKVLKKAQTGEEVTIAYIGGSITQGAGAKPIHRECYAYQSFVRFRELCGHKSGENLHYIKAGVGGTPSELGMIRYERDVLEEGTPDVVIVEFAVNDLGDETKGECYESLVRKILYHENEPAVILLFSVFADDFNLQERLAPVGYHYQLPMVSIKDAVVDQFYLTKENGRVLSKNQFFYDIYHPTNVGHRIMADSLGYLFKKVLESPEDVRLDLKEITPVIGGDFEKVRLLDRKNSYEKSWIMEGGFTDIDEELQMVERNLDSYGSSQFSNNWMHTFESRSDSFTMKIQCSSLLMVYKDSGDNAFGKAKVYVDGKYVLTADPHINGWTHCNAVILYRNLENIEHEVVIQMAEDSADKKFTILGFGVVE